MPGAELVRRYRGKDIVVRVRQDGFEYDGRIHRSLSSVVLRFSKTYSYGSVFLYAGFLARPSTHAKLLLTEEEERYLNET